MFVRPRDFEGKTVRRVLIGIDDACRIQFTDDSIMTLVAKDGKVQMREPADDASEEICRLLKQRDIYCGIIKAHVADTQKPCGLVVCIGLLRFPILPAETNHDWCHSSVFRVYSPDTGRVHVFIGLPKVVEYIYNYLEQQFLN